MTETVALAEALMACESVTPAKGMVFGVLERALVARGFTVERFVCGHPPDGPVENMLAMRGDDDGLHFAFAGHLDVVPPGDGWRGDPFMPVMHGNLLHGRGAVDMKGAIAAFVVAAGRVRDHRGRVSLLITGDEEGPATFGTPELVARIRARGLVPDLCLVGEPTSVHRLGDMMKVGRRGSVNIWITVEGTQGHVAYPHLADNPVPRLVRILAGIQAIRLDEGTRFFQPSNIEITTIDVGNTATNVIPARATARISIRFNDLHRAGDLVGRITALAEAESPRALVDARISGEAFLTPQGPLSGWVIDAVREVMGIEPEASTTGGTSDARFIAPLCPVIEFGLSNATMHKVDEAVSVTDLEDLANIYEGILRRAYAPDSYEAVRAEAGRPAELPARSSASRRARRPAKVS